MGKIGHGYGSEWHLLRYLGRHRNLLDNAVRDATRCGRFDWLDFGFDPILRIGLRSFTLIYC